ncbi:HTH_Tnp_Tc3_2 domain-containing protein [Trichonephila clavipes]|nr:HTH_Tnp_Tc3_2 domain-containing protein [Trichonephila clavipes]
MNDGETSSRRHGVGRLHAIKGKGHRRLSRMVKQNRSQTVVQLIAQYSAGPSRIVLEHTVQRTLLYMGLRSKRPTRVPLLTKRHRQLRLRWAWEHRDWSMDQLQRVAWRKVAPSMYSRSYTGRWWQYYAFGEIILNVSGTRGCGIADHECYRVSEHHCRPIAPLYDLCFSSSKWNVPTGQRPVSQDRIHLGCHETAAQSSKPPIHNISDLRNHCLNIRYNLSPAIYQGLVTSMLRRVEAVAEGGSIRC